MRRSRTPALARASSSRRSPSEAISRVSCARKTLRIRPNTQFFAVFRPLLCEIQDDPDRIVDPETSCWGPVLSTQSLLENLLSTPQLNRPEKYRESKKRRIFILIYYPFFGPLRDDFELRFELRRARRCCEARRDSGDAPGRGESAGLVRRACPSRVDVHQVSSAAGRRL